MNNSHETYEKLKSCPFCGNDPWGIFGPHDQTGWYWVECHHGDHEEFCCGDWHFPGENKQDVAAAWNKRNK